MSGWMQTVTGGSFTLRADAQVAPESIRPVDIAWALATTNRFGGHALLPVSVAEHSLGVMARVPERLRLCGLLHDAPEAYMQDITSPMGELFDEISGGRFKQWKKKFHREVYRVLGLPQLSADDRQVIKEADLRQLQWEKHSRMAESEEAWGLQFPPGDPTSPELGWSLIPQDSHPVVVFENFARAWCELVEGLSYRRDFRAPLGQLLRVLG